MKITTIALFSVLAVSALPSCTTVQPVATVPGPVSTTQQTTTTSAGVEPYTGTTTYKKTTTTSSY